MEFHLAPYSDSLLQPEVRQFVSQTCHWLPLTWQELRGSYKMLNSLTLHRQLHQAASHMLLTVQVFNIGVVLDTLFMMPDMFSTCTLLFAIMACS